MNIHDYTTTAWMNDSHLNSEMSTSSSSSACSELDGSSSSSGGRSWSSGDDIAGSASSIVELITGRSPADRFRSSHGRRARFRLQESS